MATRIDDSTEQAMNEGRGLCRVLAVGAAIAAAAALLKGKNKKEKAS